jgi:short-subunit dehydrogenase
MIGLNNKKIWLIGATHGIGEALVEKLIAHGCIVAASGRSIDKLNELKAKYGEKLIPLTCDVTDYESIKSAFEKFSNPDIVIYNAGYYEPMNCREFDLSKVEQMIDINLNGAIRLLHVLLPNWQRGTIALVGSVAGYRGLPNAIGYGLSKAAIIHLAENLRQDLPTDKFKVQIINPGFVETRLTAKNDFKMPFCITAERAAEYIIQGLKREAYEIHFPKRFTTPLKIISALPSRLYFWVSEKIL